MGEKARWCCVSLLFLGGSENAFAKTEISGRELALLRKEHTIGFRSRGVFASCGRYVIEDPPCSSGPGLLTLRRSLSI